MSEGGEKRAIIDIGSNTVRLVVFNGPPRAPVVLLNEKVTARLGRDLDRTGAIAEKGMRSALAALERYASLLALMRVDQVECVATAATRDASNGAEFLEAVRGFGLSPRLISGGEEARTSALGVLSAFPGASGVVADLGGGSLELVEIHGQEPRGGISIPFGTLRLPGLREAGPRAFAATTRKALRQADWQSKGQTIYACGGSWRALALQAMRETHWPLDDPHGFAIGGETMLTLCRRIQKGEIARPHERISSMRLETLPDAAALLGQLIVQLRVPRIVFTSWGLREGLLYAQLPERVQRQDPLLAGVTAFAEGAKVSPAHAAAIAKWTAPACEELDGEANLRLAAIMLALASMRTEPNFRTEEAMDWALRKRWIGLDPRGRGMLAMTILANGGRTQPDATLMALASPEDLARAVGWGLALRLCRRLTGCADDALAHTALRRDGGELVLQIAPRLEPLYVSATGKDLKALSECLGVECRMKVVEPAHA